MISPTNAAASRLGVLVDYHTHPMRTSAELPPAAHLAHFQASMRAYAVRAGELGLAELGFSEHIYRLSLAPDVVPWKVGKAPLGDVAAYVDAALRVRDEQTAAAAVGKGSVTVRLGMEVDIVPSTVSVLQAAAPRYPFDYFLGSVHQVPDLADDAGPQERYRGFYAAIRWAAQSGLFHSIAHPDRIHRKSAALVEAAFLEDEMERTVAVLAEHCVSAEMSGSGLRAGFRDVDPHATFVRLCRRHGVTITLGSDAHKLDVIGEGVVELRDLLWAEGYREVATFHRGRRVMRPLLPPGADVGAAPARDGQLQSPQPAEAAAAG